MGCRNITKVVNGKEVTAIEWMVDQQEPFLGLMGKGHSIPPHILTFSKDPKGNLQYSCRLGDEELKSNKENLISPPPTLKWSDRQKEFTPVEATLYFLFPIAEEPHSPIARTDMLDFQFSTIDGKSMDVKVRIAGVKFIFIPTNGPDSVLGGRVKVMAPSPISGAEIVISSPS